MLPATVTNRAAGNQAGPDWIDFYRARIDGGAGLVVAEPLAVSRSTVTSGAMLAGFDGRNDDVFKAIAEHAERADCRLLGQIMHLGRHHVHAPGRLSISPTARHDPASWAAPHKMTAVEIGEMVECFVSTAERLARVGYSGVELHGAQGFLILQFLSPTNDREDGYGGDLEGRTRFVREIARGIRQRAPADFLIGLKMPADENLDDQGLGSSDAEQIVRRLVISADFDLFAFGHGGPGRSFDEHVPDMHFPPAPFVHKLPALKAAAGGLPIVGLGRVTDAQTAEQLLQSQLCDLVGLARPLIADPQWPSKVRSNLTQEIRPCIYCNSCWAQLPKGNSIACVVNPLLNHARETTGGARRPAPRRHALIVGGGLAGLSAAAALARSGHAVMLFEAEDRLGGLAAWQNNLPGCQEIGKAIQYFALEAERYGARLCLGKRFGLEDLEGESPDAAIVATGGRFPPAAAFGWSQGVDLVAATRRMERGQIGPGGRVVVYDQTQTEATYAAVQRLTQGYDEVVVLSPRGAIATEAAQISIPGIHRRLRSASVKIETYVSNLETQEGLVRWRHAITGESRTIDDVAAFVFATPRVALDCLSEDLAAAGLRTLLVGDALAPRSMLTAVDEGALAAEELGWT